MKKKVEEVALLEVPSMQKLSGTKLTQNVLTK
jgi:hypothetical protein